MTHNLEKTSQCVRCGDLAHRGRCKGSDVSHLHTPEAREKRYASYVRTIRTRYEARRKATLIRARYLGETPKPSFLSSMRRGDAQRHTT